MKLGKSVFIVLQVWFFCPLWAQYPNITFSHYSPSDGLSDNKVSSVYQDEDRFIWVGTLLGFDRFDGKHFKNYSPNKLLHRDDMAENTLLFFESQPHKILCTICNFQAFEFNTVRQKLTPIKSLKNSLVTSFYRLNSNKIAVSLIDTLLIMNNSCHILEKIIPPLLKKEQSVSMLKCDEKRWFIYTRSEFFIYHVKEKTWQRIRFKISFANPQQAGFVILHYDSVRKELYLSNYFQGLYKANLKGDILYHWDNQNPITHVSANSTSFKIDPFNKRLAWISGEEGITLLHLDTKKIKQISYLTNQPAALVTNQIYRMYFDRNNTLWLATDKGLSKKNNFASVVQYWDVLKNPNLSISSITQSDQKTILVAQYLGNIFSLDKKTGTISPFFPGSKRGHWFVMKKENEIIAGGSDVALSVQNILTKKKSSISWKKYFPFADVLVLGIRHSNGDLWLSANQNGGLVRIEKESKKIQLFNNVQKNFSSSYFTCAAEDHYGDLWFGSNKSTALVHWKKQTNTFEEINFKNVFTTKNILRSGVNTITADKKGNIWVGFDGSGLIKYIPSSANIQFVGKKQGLPSTYVVSSAFDKHENLWMGTAKGLVCYSTKTGKVNVFDTRNGFPTESFQNNAIYFETAQNRMWIGAGHLLISFYPKKLLVSNSKFPKLYVDEILVQNKNRLVEKKDHYVFKPNENNFQIRFGILDLSKANEIEYSYKLNGDKENWVEIGNQNQINFANLSAGKYTFYLKARSKGDKDWFWLKKKLTFEIQQIWYRTLWFYFLILIGVLSAFVYYIRRVFMKKLERQKVLLEQKIAIQKERTRIAHDMHDDLGSGLTKITFLTESILKKEGEMDSIRKIQNTSLELVKNMSELIWAMKDENDTLQQLQTYIKQYAHEYLDTNFIDLKGDFCRQDELNQIQISGEIRRSIFLMIKEALHNIVKHAHCSQVQIKTRLTDVYEVSIQDNGVGFAIDTIHHKGNGLQNMKKRVESLGGEMIFTQKAGTHVHFVLPIQTIQST